jgi:hypothetical protein
MKHEVLILSFIKEGGKKLHREYILGRFCSLFAF